MLCITDPSYRAGTQQPCPALSQSTGEVSNQTTQEDLAMCIFLGKFKINCIPHNRIKWFF